MAHAHHHYDHAPRARRSFYDDSSSDFDDTRSVASSTRESFMDLTSPSTPHFSRHDRLQPQHAPDSDADDVYYGGLSVRASSDTTYSDDSPVVLSPMRFSRPERIGPVNADADSDGDTETEGEADPRPAHAHNHAPAPRGGTRAHIRVDTGHDKAVRPRISFISLSAQLTGPFNSSWLCMTGGQQARRGPKPPLPEAPKPLFHGRGPTSTSTSATKRSPSTPGGGCGTPALSLSVASSPAASASASPVRSPDVPPTTNLLNRQERAELVRKTRKLAQMFGQTPSGLAMAMAGGGVGSPRQGSPPARLVLPGHGHRGAVSISGGEGEVVGVGGQSSSSRESRRRSMPLSPSEMSTVLSDRRSGVVGGSGRQTDAESFMDLSDEERGTAGARDGRTSRVHGRLSVLSTATTTSGDGLDDMASLVLDPAEEERRRKREKLAKLHRFLGSRVPASLVLGFNDADPDASLPAPQTPLPAPAIPADGPSDTDARAWPRLRRRSSSAAEMKSVWLDPADRVKEDLDDREKAINVRRAIKMEKMFGVPPPQTLYHTRHSPAVTPHSPTSSARFSVASDLPSPSLGDVPASPTGRNINQSAYVNKGKGRRSSHRPGHSSPSESMQNLLIHNADYTLSGSPSSPSASLSLDHRASSIYMHYRHSLNSLNDIIDRDDKESLAELHQYITNDLASLDPPTSPPHNALEHPYQHPYQHPHPHPHQSPQPHQHPYTHALAQSEAKALRAERRRSLPVRTSTLSLASQYTLASPEPEMVSFQARRRRAAKLTSFFGVDYRDLVGEILDSIEHGLQEDGSRGSLQPEEMQELLQRLRKLKTKRPGLV
ncbi:hypothetical protein HETIRDRAFT_447475 [Heterobasidion irregulare TC 32-1]|uniref:Uncharacterized protein n=1 Tax=Heterobasidion irregulare (strain TC 32-1) TaxID=747525 RepID=W4KN72_HETIT|nr:uncharacterized protein HETIRDRAFT_447475 [Heterobasidion irregulare TC 32-1]ETW86815.1 hypothetical protein HETIRDRAFT_447475 [Heterobasidion irregulare TC 32-1]